MYVSFLSNCIYLLKLLIFFKLDKKNDEFLFHNMYKFLNEKSYGTIFSNLGGPKN